VTSRTKAKDDEQQAAQTDQTQAEGEPAAEVQEVAVCGRPHFLPALADRVTCTGPAPDPDLPPGTPEHEHRHQDGDALYVWR
jgi:hypothetical protein